jgi:uncharacterized protein
MPSVDFTLGKFEIRDPIHGFIELNQLEWDIINHPVFQRLRRIRQLAWTDVVYPGAMHTRFAHSLGVMHVAARVFASICARDKQVLEGEYKYNSDQLNRQLQIIRIAALLHDVGHTPFSHAGEHLLPIDPKTGEAHTHEDYSKSIVLNCLGDLVDSHKSAQRVGIKISDISSVFAGGIPTRADLVWKPIVSGQMDADRMDYLLRDAYHTGVSYGRYDLDRVIHSLRLCPSLEGEGHQIGVDEGGVHAIEGLLLARYMMFTQLYFHKTRSIYDHHLEECLSTILAGAGGKFPPPPENADSEYLKWDDWRVLGAIAEGNGGTHGAILRDRRHFRLVHKTSESPEPAEIDRFDLVARQLEPLGAVTKKASQSWYKIDTGRSIPILVDAGTLQRTMPLDQMSNIVQGLRPVNIHRLYVPQERRGDALVRLEKLKTGLVNT